MATTLGAVAEGSIVYLNESGVAVPFYVAKHNYESALNGAGRTLLVRKDCYHTIAVNGDGTATNTYADKTYDTWLNGTYKALLDSFAQTAMATTTFYYTVGGGGAAATTLTRSIFGLSLTEFGLSSSSFNVEGSALPIADTLKIAYLDGTAVIQNTRSAGPNNTSTMGYVSATGTVYVDMHAANKRGSRPCFTLPSTQGVDSSNNIIDGTGDTTPETYTKLEYITSSGTQYIDTGFKPNNNTRAIADVSISSSKTTQALFGGRTSASTTSGAMFAVFTLNTTTIRSDYNGAYTQSLNCPRDTRVTIDKNKETTSVNGNSASYTNASFQSAATLTIFALNENGTIESGTIGVMTLYSFKLYDNNTLVRDFIPARRNSDGAIGLLDQANNVFYGNAGTGTFTAGPEIASTGSLANIGGTSVLLTGCLANVGGIECAIPYALANVDGIEVVIPFGEAYETIDVVPYQTGTLTYTGSALTPTWAGYDESTLIIGGTTSATNAGTYTATFTPADGYVWADTMEAETRSVNWVIGKAAGKVTLSKTSISLASGDITTFTVSRSGDGAISPSISNAAVALYSLSGTTVTVHAALEGSAIITINVAEGTNHLAASATCSVTVTAAMRTVTLTGTD